MESVGKRLTSENPELLLSQNSCIRITTNSTYESSYYALLGGPVKPS